VTEPLARRTAFLVLALYLILGVAYSVVNPIFESPDESLNYANIRFLVEERRLPVLSPDEPTKAHHPPAYYALGALLTSWVPNENYDLITERVNPFWIHRVDEPGVDNKNLYLHNPALEGFPYRDVALGVHLVRWLSLLMGGATILLVYATTRELVPLRPALAVLSTTLVALNPMFLFISGSVHDDALANLVAAGLLYLAARMVRRGATVRRALALGTLAGLALLTKLTCLLVMPTVGLALLVALAGDDGRIRWRELLRLGAIAVGVALLVGGWWLIRNQFVYGEPTSMARQVEAWGGFRSNAPDLAAAVRELGFLHDSFWGVFGYGQLPMPAVAYAVPRLLGLLSLGGWALATVRRRTQRTSPAVAPPGHLQRSTIAVLASAGVITFAVVFVRMTLIDTANFGRYLFVSLAFVAPLYALGLVEWTGGQTRLVTAGVGAVMLGLALFALLGVLRPAYGSPRMVSPEGVRARAEATDIRFGESIRLVGKDVSTRRTLPGREIEVTLCWEALETMDENYVAFVHLLGEHERIVGARNTHPGLGRYPTRRWSPGDRFCDVLDLKVDEAAPAPAVYAVEIGWHDASGEIRLPAHAPDGSPQGLVLVDRIKVAPEEYPTVAVPRRLDADLGGEIRLLGYEISETELAAGESLDVTLFWRAEAQPTEDYSVFLHLAAESGPPHAQDDGQPEDGTYPTSFWDAGEVVKETRRIQIPRDLPSGDYPLVAGLYVLETGRRLPHVGPDGTVQGDGVTVETVTVVAGDS
jgi:hypothetical protein